MPSHKARKWVVLCGERYGRGVVLTEFAHHITDRAGQTRQFRWLRMRCDCGTVYEAQLQKVCSGRTQSCGCLRRERAAAGAESRNAAKDAYVRAGDPDFKRRRYLLQFYGLTLERYNEILEIQGGVCAICKRPPGRRPLHVDHDHSCCPQEKRSCGKCVRGLLCFSCNGFLGRLETLGGVAEAYLLRWEGGD